MQSDDQITKIRLREIKQPIHLFGETYEQRLQRLTDFLQQYALEHGEHFQFKQYPLSGNWKDKAVRQTNVNLTTLAALTPDEEYLVKCRKKILYSSLVLAAGRHKLAKKRLESFDAIQIQQQFDAKAQASCEYQMTATQFGDISNVMRGCFSSDGTLYATAGGSSEARIWSIPGADEKSKLFGHRGKVHDIAFHPLAGILPKGAPNIATASTDSEIKLWTLDLNLEYQKSFSLREHTDRANRVIYHNTGDYLFSVSFDETWIFWDLTKAKKLYKQTGHHQPIYALAMHPDGSLIFTGDTKGKGMVWDLRSGKSILPIVGHKDGILGCDFAPNGFLLATSSEDNTIRVWDIRRKSNMSTIPAHTKLISDVRFNSEGSVLVSASHDGTMKMWHGHNFALLKNYRAHQSKISSLAISRMHIVTTTLDRKWTLWDRIPEKTVKEEPTI